MRDSLELTRSEFVTRNVMSSVNLDSTLPLVLADRVQMQQVVLNLFMNACEAMVGTPTANRQVVISTRFLPVSEAARNHGTGQRHRHSAGRYRKNFSTIRNHEDTWTRPGTGHLPIGR